MTKGDKFDQAVAKYVNTFNPETISCGGISWIILTTLGSLEINTHESTKRQGLFSIFMRFKDVGKAKEKVDCNPNSGKWNIHESSPERALEILESHLSEIGIKKLNKNELEKISYVLMYNKEGVLEPCKDIEGEEIRRNDLEIAIEATDDAMAFYAGKTVQVVKEIREVVETLEIPDVLPREE